MSILVEIVDDKIWMKIPWLGKQGTAACKSIRGARWNPDYKVWTYPLDWVVCLEIRKMVANPFRQEIKFGPNMVEWATAEKERQSRVPDVNSFELVDLPGVKARNPAMWSALSSRPFQTVGVAYGVARRSLLLADEPGLGKTVQTLGILEESCLRGPILVIAPSTAIQVTWPQQIEAWCGPNDEFFVLGDEAPEARAEALRQVYRDCENDPDLRVWVLTTSHYVRMSAELDRFGNYKYEEGSKKVKIVSCNMPELFETEWSGLIIDESQEFVSGATGNKKKWSAQRFGLGALRVKDGGVKLALSGTPFKGKPENLFGTLQWLRPDLYTSYWKWVARYFVMYEDGNGVKEFGDLKDEDLFWEEAAEVTVRRTKGEVASDLPPKTYAGEPLDANDPDSPVAVWLDMLPAQAKQYRSMVTDAAVSMAGGTLTANGILAEMTRMKQFSNATQDIKKVKVNKIIKFTDEEVKVEYFNRIVKIFGGSTDINLVVPHQIKAVVEEQVVTPKLPSNKFNWIMNWLTERGIAGRVKCGDGKVIIASQFTKLLNLYNAELNKNGVKTFLLTGETSSKKRVAYQEEFQSTRGEDEVRVFLLNTKAGGTSITLDAADDVIIVDETSIPDDQLQVEDRAHRISRTDHNVTIWKLRSLGTIEESISKVTDQREFVTKFLMEGQRGVDFTKKFLSAG